MGATLRYGDPDEVGMSPERVRLIHRRAADWVASGRAAALVLLVARRGVVVMHEAFGRLGPEEDAPALGPDAIFPIASMTKPITAACAMCLVEDGLLGLNRPVQEYLPEFVGAGKEQVMVHHLLTHTSGITNEALDAHVRSRLAAGLVLSDEQYPGVSAIPVDLIGYTSLPLLYDAPLATRPGSTMSYCNHGYCLLAEIVARAAGQPAAQLAAERVFGPLGMADTCFVGVEESRRERLVRADPDSAFAALNNQHLPGLMVGAASATSTALDMAAFGQSFLEAGRGGQARILSRASVTAMTRDQAPGVEAIYGTERFSHAGWGLGWGIQLEKKAVNHPTLASAGAFNHTGSGGTCLWVDPAEELVLAYFSVETVGEIAGVHQWNLDLFVNMAVAAVR